MKILAKASVALALSLSVIADFDLFYVAKKGDIAEGGDTPGEHSWAVVDGYPSLDLLEVRAPLSHINAQTNSVSERQTSLMATPDHAQPKERRQHLGNSMRRLRMRATARRYRSHGAALRPIGFME